MSVRIGTSGFSYDDWVGPFYPRALSKSKWFEYYSQEFSCLEINASYYSWMTPRAMQSLASRAPVGFRFAVKLHRSITHGDEDIERAIHATLEQNAPLEDAIHLAQFPNAFRPSDASFRKLEILAQLPRLVVEFRNSEWQNDSTYAFLRDIGVSLCAVDSPRIDGLPQFSEEITGAISYTRLHGRNAAKWYNHEHAYERYDYLYQEKQIAEIGDAVMRMSEKATESFVFFNNHYGAQAVTNARQLAQQLGITVTPAQPDLFE